jgi:predicted transcriptional regulator
VTDRKPVQLSKRERQIMDAIYRRGAATAAEVHAAIPDPPSYSAVRALLRILEEKGHLTHAQDGPRYVYSPVVSRTAARESALRGIVRTFFDGSPTEAVAALLDMSDGKLSRTDLDEIAGLIRRAKKEGR